MKKTIKSILLLIFICLLSLMSKSVIKSIEPSEPILKDREIIKPKEIEITLSSVGDIMFHRPMYKNNYNVETGEYNFNSYYRKMGQYINRADLMVGNYEATTNPNMELSGFPYFNVPVESIKSLKAQGFDLLLTGNNHCIDTGRDGIVSTIDAMNKYGMYHTGTFVGPLRDGIIINIKGINVGILSYSQRFNGLESRISKEESYMINMLEIERVKNDIVELKSRKADIIVVYPHWGEEYSTVPNEYEKEMGNMIFDAGADIILGSHPHVIQRGESVVKEGKLKYILYSMGNSISNQRFETMGNYNVECGIFAEIKIKKNLGNNETTIKEVNLIPTYVNRVYNPQGYYELEVVAIDDYLENGIFAHEADDKLKTRLIKNKEKVNNILNTKTKE